MEETSAEESIQLIFYWDVKKCFLSLSPSLQAVVAEVFFFSGRKHLHVPSNKQHNPLVFPS